MKPSCSARLHVAHHVGILLGDVIIETERVVVHHDRNPLADFLDFASDGLSNGGDVLRAADVQSLEIEKQDIALRIKGQAIGQIEIDQS